MYSLLPLILPYLLIKVNQEIRLLYKLALFEDCQAHQQYNHNDKHRNDSN